MKYGTILADPPWPYDVWSDADKNHPHPEKHYGTLTIDDICMLPMLSIAADDCVLLLWATSPHLENAFKVIRAWGFEYKSAIYWLKMNRLAVVQMGCGYHSRACVEPILIAVRGKPLAPARGKRPLGLQFGEDAGSLVVPRGRHSAKPESQYEIAEGYAGPYVEVFSRNNPGMFESRPGWAFLGNEIDGLDIRDALKIESERPAEPCRTG